MAFFENEEEDQDAVLPEGVDPEEEADVEGQEEQIEKIKIGEEEYTQEELNSLVGLGKTAKQIQEEQNTDLSKVFPEYTKSRQEIKELKEQLEQLQNKGADVPELPENQQQAMEEAKKVLKQMGVVTQEDIRDVMSPIVREIYQQEEAGKELLNKGRDLEKQYDGADGRPKFDTREILEYMQETGLQDLETAYKVKNEKSLDAWKEKRLKEGQKPNLETESTSTAGAKSPSEVKITEDNLEQLISESLRG